MTSPLEERILDLTVLKLATITIGNGYQETVLAVNIRRPPQQVYAFQTSECPGLSVRFEGLTLRSHLRDAEELLLHMNIQCVSTTFALLRALVSDVKKLIYANRFWNDGSANLARRSWIEDAQAHETEIDEPLVTGSVHFTVLARASKTDPTSVKLV